MTKIDIAETVNFEEIAIGVQMKPHKILLQGDLKDVFESTGIACEHAQRLVNRCMYNSEVALLDVEIPSHLQEVCFKSFHPSEFDCMLHATVTSTMENQNRQGIQETECNVVVPQQRQVYLALDN